MGFIIPEIPLQAREEVEPYYPSVPVSPGLNEMLHQESLDGF